MPSLTRECEQKFVPTFPASDTCKAIMEDAAIKEAINDLSHIRPEKTILSFKAIIIDLFKCFEIYPVKLNDPIPDDICVFYKRSKTRSIYEIYYLTG